VQLAERLLLLRNLQTGRSVTAADGISLLTGRSMTAADGISLLTVSIAGTDSCRQKSIQMCRLDLADFWRFTDKKRHIFEGNLQTCRVLLCAVQTC
jgi:hypothetical protein